MWEREEILEMRRAGLTLQAIADRFDLTKERVRQIIQGEPERVEVSVSDKLMLTVSDVAQLLGIHANTVRRWAQKGVLKVYRLGARGDRRFRRQDIDSFLELSRD